MVGWHHGLNGHEFEQATGDSDRGGSLECCSPWGRKELDAAERLKKRVYMYMYMCVCVCMYVCICQTVITNQVEQGSCEQPQAVGEGQKCWLDQLVREGLQV